MPVLKYPLDQSSEESLANRAALEPFLARLRDYIDQAVGGGGEKYVTRHHRRGKLLARERIELLVDRDSPFLELSPIAGAETDFPVGGSVIVGIGAVEGVICLVVASDPTVRGGAVNPITLAKGLRAYEIAEENRLPLLYLVESGGADLPSQAEIFVPGGASFRQLTRLSARGIPSISVVFGNSTAGGAYLPGMSDYVVMIRDRSKVFLGGPPLVKMATGEVSTDEELGGALMHARTSGLADYLADDEVDAIRIAREIVRSLNHRRRGPSPELPVREPLYDPHEMGGLIPVDPKRPLPVRAVLARILDGSELFEHKPDYGTNLVTGWGHIHGFRVGILANDQGVLFSAESLKATQFIQLANARDVPLLFVQNVTGYMVGREYEQAGIIKHGAMMINAVSNSTVPHLTLQIGASFGAGNYGMCGRAYAPRFLFIWPNARTAVMGAEQLAGVLSIVSRQAAQAAGREYDEEQDAARTAYIEAQIEREASAFFTSGRLLDDGIIEPADTRTVLGVALWAVHNAPVQGTRSFGVFRP